MSPTWRASLTIVAQEVSVALSLAHLVINSTGSAMARSTAMSRCFSRTPKMCRHHWFINLAPKRMEEDPGGRSVRLIISVT